MGGEKQQFFHNTRHLIITGGFCISSCWRYCAHKHRFPPPKCGCVFLVCVVWRRRNAGAGAPFHTSSLTDERHDTMAVYHHYIKILFNKMSFSDIIMKIFRSPLTLIIISKKTGKIFKKNSTSYIRTFSKSLSRNTLNYQHRTPNYAH